MFHKRKRLLECLEKIIARGWATSMLYLYLEESDVWSVPPWSQVAVSEGGQFSCKQ